MSTILIVDDDPHLRELSRIFLRQEGFTITEACDGVEALAKIACGKVDLVILDIMMPKMDGLDVHINRLRERFPEAHHTFRIKTIRGLGYRLEVIG